MRFVNRKEELRSLSELRALSSKKLFVVAYYGMRRVGKTRLLLEFLKGGGMYFFVNKNKTQADLLAEFQDILKKNKVLGELEALQTWDKFFEVLVSRHTSPVVFDEFQNFASVRPEVFGILQKTIDLNEGGPGLIILSGSLIGIMKRLFKGSKEPLYGRLKTSTKVEPLSLRSCLEMGNDLRLDKEELLKLYFLFGGYPKYFVAVEDFNLQAKTAEGIINAMFFVRDAPLEEEASSILSQEFGSRSGTYYSILEAIATGNNTLSSIAGYLNVPATSITRQVAELRNLFELVELEMPYNGKRGIYRITHPLLEFWFSQIYKNFSDYASRNQEFMASIKKKMNNIYGRRFEQASKEFLTGELGLRSARRQWGKIPLANKGENTYEIDMIGEGDKVTYVFEFKWKELSYYDALQVLGGLEIKAKYVDGMPKDIKFGILAKKVHEKGKIRDKGYAVYDIDDM